MTLNLNSRASDDLIIATQLLLDNGSFSSLDEIISFLEKPWNYKKELEDLGQEVL